MCWQGWGWGEDRRANWKHISQAAFYIWLQYRNTMWCSVKGCYKFQGVGLSAHSFKVSGTMINFYPLIFWVYHIEFHERVKKRCLPFANIYISSGDVKVWKKCKICKLDGWWHNTLNPIEYRSVTSHYHGNDLTGSKQWAIWTNMVAITIGALTSFLSGEPKSIHQGENHYKSGHIQLFHYSNGIIRGLVHASMKDKSYKVTVCDQYLTLVLWLTDIEIFCKLKVMSTCFSNKYRFLSMVVK